MLQNAVSAFNGDIRLRLGGSLADFVVYNISGTANDYCHFIDFSAPTNTSRLGYEIFSGCLNMNRWDQWNHFCSIAKCDIIFGLNALWGRNLPGPCDSNVNCRIKPVNECCTNWTGLWDSSQVELFLDYTASKDYNIYAFEFGNELVGNNGIESHISVNDYTTDWKRFVDIFDSIYTNKNSAIKIPKKIVPDATFEKEWFSHFLSGLNGSIYSPDIVSHHLYSLGAGSDEDVGMKALNATYLDKVITLGKEVYSTVQTSCPTSEIWMGEGGGAYNSGRDDVTNTFNSGFWYLDQMAVLASTGHKAYCRQTLVGGNYGMLDWFSYEPNPDYYSLLLWSKLMGRNVLKSTILNTSTSHQLRAYAHCSKDNSNIYTNFTKGSVTILLINLSNITTITVPHIYIGTNTTNKTSNVNLLSTLYRLDYVLSSGCNGNESVILACRNVLLNGVPLLVRDYNIPDLIPKFVDKNISINMAPLTYGFFVFLNASLDICM
jgi:heparanase 1